MTSCRSLPFWIFAGNLVDIRGLNTVRDTEHGPRTVDLWHAGLAINRLTDPDIYDDNCAVSEPTSVSYPQFGWWVVDLLQVSAIDSVRVFSALENQGRKELMISLAKRSHACRTCHGVWSYIQLIQLMSPNYSVN